MSEVSRNANAYTIQEENSTTYCTPRSTGQARRLVWLDYTIDATH